MEFTTISTTHTMIRSSILGDGAMVGLGDLGAAGMADFGDGTTLIAGATGDGDLDGIMDGTDITPGTTVAIPTGVDSATGSTGGSLSGPVNLPTEAMQAGRQELSLDAPMA